MFKVLLVTPNQADLVTLASALEQYKNVQMSWVTSGSQTLDRASETHVDLVVTDENLGDMTGLELAERLLKLNPMINCALISTLSTEEFHEAGEGLGIMAQLPISPGADHADKLLNRLKKIVGSLKERPFKTRTLAETTVSTPKRVPQRGRR